MKIYTTGRTYTGKTEKNSRKLSRGVEFPQVHPGDDPRRLFNPELLKQLRSDPDWVLRETISVLDKVIRKPRRLSQFETEAYENRVLLAEALWNNVVAKLLGQDGDEAEQLRKRWEQRAHPYAEHEVGQELPESDDNYKAIVTLRSKATRELKAAIDFEGRWYPALARKTNAGKLDVSATATRIQGHLLYQELMIDGNERLAVDKPGSERKPSGKGFIQRRLEALGTSVHDPRTVRKRRSFGQRESEACKLYFANDIAASLKEKIGKMNDFDNGPRADFFGRALHVHFKSLESATAGYSKNQMKPVWDVHNAVRRFYAKLSKSEKFYQCRRALAASINAGEAKIENGKEDKTAQAEYEAARNRFFQLLPDDHEHLSSLIFAKERNQHNSQFIRLGKLIVHASEAASNVSDNAEQLQNEFRTQMDYFATSDGQSAIKRAETFTRVFRNSVGLSHRTLTALMTADPDKPPMAAIGDGEGTDNFDIAADPVQNCALSDAYFSKDHYDQHIQLIFGKKEFALGGGTSRAAIMAAGEGLQVNDKTAVARALLKVMNKIRNRTHHFCTLSRLAKLLQENFVEGEVATRAFNRLKKLLQFDRDIEAQVLADELNKLKLAAFMKGEIDVLLRELVVQGPGDSAPAPRVLAVLRRLGKLSENTRAPLPENLAELAGLKLDSNSLSLQNANACKAGVLRLLYNSGFRVWLETDEAKTVLSDILSNVVAHKKERTEQYLQSKGWIHKFSDELIGTMGVKLDWTLKDIFKHITARSAAEEGTNQSYGSNRSKQADVANRLERFRQELYGHLFAQYLDTRSLTDFLQIEDLDEEVATDAEVSVETIKTIMKTPGDVEDWHPPLYAWLYTIPVEDVARLRHQMQKSIVLEKKGFGENNKNVMTVLSQLDELMRLYIRVQAAGFDGTEHGAIVGLGTFFYQDAAQFDRVFSDETELNDETYAGTRSGLRRILRFGHLRSLHKLYQKHKISVDEVDTLIAARTAGQSATSQAQQARETVLKLFDSLSTAKSDEIRNIKKQLSSSCAVYQEKVIDARFQDFQVRGARLGEQARIHDLMLRIVGRLMDYTLMWERDMAFLWLGMFFIQERAQGRDLQLVYDPTEGEARKTTGLKTVLSQETGFLKLWNEKTAFSLPKYMLISKFLDSPCRDIHRQYSFGRDSNHQSGPDSRYQKDLISNARLKAERKLHRPLDKSNRAKIRDDLAHYNLFAHLAKGELNRNKTKRIYPPWNLTYTVNAVRSLFGYDRKMKNAVSGSIIKLLQREGFGLSWSMQDDRLTKAVVTPLLEQHLTMMPKSDEQDFALPVHSPRMVSMAQALFQFDKAGNRAQISVKVGREGAILYPDPVLDHKSGVPKRMRTAQNS